MPATVVLGMQWGDEGKGKVIDLLAGDASWAVRFQGGANAGHTVKRRGEKFALHLLPSGAVRKNVRCGLGWGMVIDPDQLIGEIEQLEEMGIEIRSRLLISPRAAFVLPCHAARDAAEESRRSGETIGTTGRGIGPAYEDRTGRRALLLASLLDEDGKKRFDAAQAGAGDDAVVSDAAWNRWRETIGPLLGDCAAAVHGALAKGERVLLEGAQGTHLDLFAGTYPFVTSSSTLAGSACVGAGVGPTAIDTVAGVAKAYTTRVGNGPFPTEAAGKDADRLRTKGFEVGTTTGRPRRCGWLDLPLLRSSVMWNGVTEIALTKLDVLSGMKEIPVAVAYEESGGTIDTVPPSPGALGRVRPIYEMWPGWEEFPSDVSRFEDLPSSARRYVRKTAGSLGVPVTLVSIGADRKASIRCRIDP